MNKIIMLGTGHGLVYNLNNTCFLVQNNQNYFLIDTGGGVKTLENMEKISIGIDKIHDIFISHKHNDHLLGLSWILKKISTLRKKGEYENELNIYCNDEVAKSIEYLLKSVNDEKHVDNIYQYLKIHIVENEETLKIMDNNYTFFDTMSRGSKLFGFETVLDNNKKLVFLGDVPCDKDNYCRIRSADYVMHEAFCLDSEESIFKPYEKHHSTVKSACEALNDFNIKNLILFHTEETHIKDRKELYTAEAKLYFNGNIVVPNDLEEIIL